ncbi:hypothetical protein [Hoylesella buccalis]|uniref:hypothetical protein n=1 Tax=Hoylesella buccalis TaxID=28127 RepID=UPI003904CCDC
MSTKAKEENSSAKVEKRYVYGWLILNVCLRAVNLKLNALSRVVAAIVPYSVEHISS